jgi:hypothetical protein
MPRTHRYTVSSRSLFVWWSCNWPTGARMCGARWPICLSICASEAAGPTIRRIFPVKAYPDISSHGRLARVCPFVSAGRARQILDAIERLFHNECAFKPVYLFGPPELEMVHAKVIFLGVSFLPVDPEKSGYRETSEISRFFCSRLLEQTLKFKKSEHETNILLE